MICPQCKLAIPEISRYCLHCGCYLNPSEGQREDEEIDWENRVLCSDGTCTGTIANGTCTVCGKPPFAQ